MMKKYLAAALALAAVLWAAGALADAHTCRVIYFGRYEQDGDPSNGPEPIEWLAISDNGGGRMTLLSRYVLDARPYGDDCYDCYWDGVLRQWLNGEFCQAAFTEAERAAIQPVRNDYDVHEDEGVVYHHDCEDMVWLLSREEMLYDFDTPASRLAQPTAYAVSRGVWAQDTGAHRGNCLYWLRDGGDYGAQAIDCQGMFCQEDYFRCGIAFESDYVGVRPVIEVALPEDQLPDAWATLPDTVMFGWYEQGEGTGGPIAYLSDFTATGGKPLEWEILSESDGELLLISRYALRRMPFDRSGGTDWADSTLRRWLNSTFLESAFPEAERALLVSQSGDLVSLPARKDVLRAVGEGWDPRAACTELALCGTAYPSCVMDWYSWWLLDGQYVGHTGSICRNGQADDSDDGDHGVRPVIRVRGTRAQLADLTRTAGQRVNRAAMPHPDLDRKYIETEAAALTLREGPGEDYAQTATLPVTEDIRATAWETGADGADWVLLECMLDGQMVSGYVPSAVVPKEQYWDDVVLNRPAACAAQAEVYAAASLLTAARGRIDAGTPVTLMLYDGDYALVEYPDPATGARRRGYVYAKAIAAS